MTRTNGFSSLNVNLNESAGATSNLTETRDQEHSILKGRARRIPARRDRSETNIPGER